MKKQNDLYDTSSIKKMEELEHIRSKSEMYIGDVSDATKLLIECIDNAFDELLTGNANKIKVEINNNVGCFSVYDNGRGIPFDKNLELYKDPPVLICHSLFTSGKFDKNSYKISSGLHGIGLTACNALSNKMNIKVQRNGVVGEYNFQYKKEPTREFTKVKKSQSSEWSTIVTVYPSEKFFKNCIVDIKTIQQKLELVSAFNETFKVFLKIDDDNERSIKINKNDLILKHLGFESDYKPPIDYIEIQDKNSDNESYYIKMFWDFENEYVKPNYFTVVNLLKVDDGSHVNKVLDDIKNIFEKQSKKTEYEFNQNDCLNWLRCYIELNAKNAHFNSQTKERLSRSSNIDILNSFEKKLSDYFKNNEVSLKKCMESFHNYRKSIQNKKLMKTTKSTKRGMSQSSKLMDCTESNGELIIAEGDSAISGLVSTRNEKKHALMPVMGKILNVVKKSTADCLENKIIGDIISALGCGIDPHCDISKLRYDRIIIASDADPDGKHIAALLIIMFAKLVPDLVKSGRLYLCETPLYGIGQYENFKPIWTDAELNKARTSGAHVRRFKGLGEFNPEELCNFILNQKYRRIVKIKWSENKDKIFKLFSKDSADRKLLTTGDWSIDS